MWKSYTSEKINFNSPQRREKSSEKGCDGGWCGYLKAAIKFL